MPKKVKKENAKPSRTHLRLQAILAAVPDIIMEVDQNKVYVWANRVGYDFFGADVVGREAALYFVGEQDTYAVVNPLFAGDENLIQLESWQRRRDGESRLLAWRCRVLKDGKGNVTGALSSARDITEIRLAEKAVRESEEKFKYIFDHSIVGKSFTLPSGEINVNKAFCDMLGYSLEELKTRKWQELTCPDDVPSTQKELDAILSGAKDSVRFEKRYIHKNGSIVWGAVSTSLRRDKDGQPLYFMTSVIDISEKKRAEEALQASEQRLRRFYESGMLGAFYWDMAGHISAANDKFLEMVGYTREELERGLIDWTRMTPPEFRHLDEISLKELKAYGVNKTPFEKEYFHKNGSRVPILITGAMLDEEFFNGVAFVMDISELKRNKEAGDATRRLMQEITDNSPTLIYALDRQGRFILINRMLERVLGVPRESMIGKTRDAILPAEIASAHRCNDLKVMKTLQPLTFEEENNEPDGKHTYFSIKFPLLDAQGLVHGIGGISSDISDRKQTEDKIRNSLEEKELLLREIHHRVKNNLTTIIGLIGMDGQKTSNGTFHSLLLELEGRIRSMALVHESLCRSESLAHIDLQNYIETLSAHIRSQFGPERDICFSVQAVGVEVGLDTAIPCGLILNELITNAYKHAFPDDKPHFAPGGRTIIVSVEEAGDYYALTVADNGIGLPAGLDWEKAETLGLRLIHMLSRQINGTVRWECAAGTAFHLRLPRCRSTALGGTR